MELHAARPKPCRLAKAPIWGKAVYLCHGFCEIGALDAPFPTLGPMIESGRRVFVMAVVDTLNGVGD